jgi:hypothetical protein
MKIESVEVIPMSKDSKWEETQEPYEVFGVTTSYSEWLVDSIEKSSLGCNGQEFEMDSNCIEFAQKQSVFMTAPTAKFGNTLFVARTRLTPSLKDIRLDGPLYRVFTVKVDDIEAGKIVTRSYVDPDTFEIMFGPWYPKKTEYIIRYGIVNG